MRTLFTNRLFSWTYAIFLLFPVLFETSYFSNPITSTATMSDKKQAAAELLKQYQIIKKLEAQFPMLKQICAKLPDTALVNQICAKIEAQLTKQETTQVALTTATPEPNEDINKDEFEAAIDNWAIKHQTAFRNIISAEKIQVQFLKDKLADVAKNSNYKVILGLIESMTNVLSEDTMPLDKIIAGFNKCIDDVALKTGKELKELYKEGKKGRKGEKDEKGTKGYQDASEADFKTALDNIDPSKWLAEEVAASSDGIKIIADTFVTEYSRIFSISGINITALKNDTLNLNIADIAVIQQEMQKFLKQAYGEEFIGIADGVSDCKTSASICIKLGKNLAIYSDPSKLKTIFEGNSKYKTTPLNSNGDLSVVLFNIIKNNSGGVVLTIDDFTKALDTWRKESKNQIDKFIQSHNCINCEASLEIFMAALTKSYSNDVMYNLITVIAKDIETAFKGQDLVSFDVLKTAINKSIDELPSNMANSNVDYFSIWQINRSLPSSSGWEKVIELAKIEFSFDLFQAEVEQWASNASSAVDTAIGALKWETDMLLDPKKILANTVRNLKLNSNGGQAFKAVFLPIFLDKLKVFAALKTVSIENFNDLWKNQVLLAVKDKAALLTVFNNLVGLNVGAKKAFFQEFKTAALSKTQVQNILFESQYIANPPKIYEQAFKFAHVMMNTIKNKAVLINYSLPLIYGQGANNTSILQPDLNKLVFENGRQEMAVDGYLLRLQNPKMTKKPVPDGSGCHYECTLTLVIKKSDSTHTTNTEGKWQNKPSDWIKNYSNISEYIDTDSKTYEEVAAIGDELLEGAIKLSPVDVSGITDVVMQKKDDETNGEITIGGEEVIDIDFDLAYYVNGNLETEVNNDPASNLFTEHASMQSRELGKSKSLRVQGLTKLSSLKILK